MTSEIMSDEQQGVECSLQATYVYKLELPREQGVVCKHYTIGRLYEYHIFVALLYKEDVR